MKSSVAPAGRLVLNADDFALSDESDAAEDTDARYLVGISADAPVLRRHLLYGGDACWVENGSITIRESGLAQSIADVRRLPSTRDGTIPFAVHNALIATAIARSCGIPEGVIAAGLAVHEARPESDAWLVQCVRRWIGDNRRGPADAIVVPAQFTSSLRESRLRPANSRRRSHA